MDVMDELNIKDDSPRVHPEDAAANSDSDNRSEEEQDTDRELEISDDENYKIPGTSERDNTMFKSSSKFAGRFNTVSAASYYDIVWSKHVIIFFLEHVDDVFFLGYRV